MSLSVPLVDLGVTVAANAGGGLFGQGQDYRPDVKAAGPIFKELTQILAGARGRHRLGHSYD